MIQKMLCVCKGNTCRSSMLEVLLIATLKEKGVSDIVVESAGTYIGVDPSLVGSSATFHSITCMKKRGLNLNDHRSRRISDLNLNDYDLIICMTMSEAEEILRHNPRGAILLAYADNGGIPNPWKQGLDKYEECAQVLEKVAEKVVKTYT